MIEIHFSFQNYIRILFEVGIAFFYNIVDFSSYSNEKLLRCQSPERRIKVGVNVVNILISFYRKF